MKASLLREKLTKLIADYGDVDLTVVITEDQKKMPWRHFGIAHLHVPVVREHEPEYGEIHLI